VAGLAAEGSLVRLSPSCSFRSARGPSKAVLHLTGPVGKVPRRLGMADQPTAAGAVARVGDAGRSRGVVHQGGCEADGATHRDIGVVGEVVADGYGRTLPVA
jgi:hypothetical protein